MTGVGIILFVLTFLFSLRRYTRRYHLNINIFIRYLPFYLLALYLISTYIWWLVTDYTLLPLSIKQLLLYISPAGYPFHLVGIVLGCLGIGIHVLLRVEQQEQKKKRLDACLHSLCLACIPLGIFLLLGDNFIGKTTETSFFVTAIRSDSNLAIYGKVIPLGLFLSLRGLLSHVSMNIYTNITKKHVHYGGYVLFCLGICIITMYQQYPRHIVTSFAGMTFDIKQYVLILCSIYFARKRLTRIDSHDISRKHEENHDEADTVVAL